jgi:hypothetical protein
MPNTLSLSIKYLGSTGLRPVFSDSQPLKQPGQSGNSQLITGNCLAENIGLGFQTISLDRVLFT